MKLKVHYFYRVPNNGLFVRLDEIADGAFKIYTENVIGKRIDDGESKIIDEKPLIEMSRCKHCGEYVALAMVDTADWTYEPIATDDSDMFDLVEAEDGDESTKKYAIFGLTNEKNSKGDNNVSFHVLPGGKLEPMTPSEIEAEERKALAGTEAVIARSCTLSIIRRSNLRQNPLQMQSKQESEIQRRRSKATLTAIWKIIVSRSSVFLPNLSHA